MILRLMLILVITSLILGDPTPSLSQPHSPVFVKRAGGSLRDVGLGVATDSLGNTFVTGFFQGTALFDDVRLSSAGNSDVFVAKYDPQGALLWVRQAGGPGEDVGVDITLDSSANIYITGFFQEVIDFQGMRLRGVGGQDVFVAKYNSEGRPLWVRRAGGPSQDNGIGIATDENGRVFVTGWFQGKADFAGVELHAAGGPDIFLAMYDAEGRLLWARRAGGPALDVGMGIAVDRGSHLFLTGFFEGRADFDGMELTSAGGQDVFLARYDQEGRLLWARRAGGPGQDNGLDLAVDQEGNLFITGFFQDTADFSTASLTSSGDSDIFVAEYDLMGELQWAVQAGGPLTDIGVGIAHDNKNTFITGYYQKEASFGRSRLAVRGGQDIFIAQVDEKGEVLRVEAGGGPGADHGMDIAVDSLGSLHLTGLFEGTADFAGLVLISAGGEDIVVATLW